MPKQMVVVVDDEKGFLDIIQIILKRAGYTPLAVQDSREAMKLIETLLPDAIILDDNMPHLTGAEICQQIKKNDKTRHIPVVMYTAGTRLEKSSYQVQTGANHVLFKPCMPDEILKAIRLVLDGVQV
ncbi:MAG: response regulator [Phototrophicaceae bacterium]